MGAGSPGRSLAFLVLAVVLAGCAAFAAPTAPTAPTAVAAATEPMYPMPDEPPNTHQWNPTAVGTPIRAVLAYLEVRPGDRIELLGGQAIGDLDGATTSLLLSRPVDHDDGTRTWGEAFEPLEGAVVAAVSASPGPENTVAIAAEMTPSRPGRFEISNVRIMYRLNGGPEQQGTGIDTIWTVCADDPKPSDCPEEAPS